MQADKAVVMQILKTARGQIDAIIKMVEDDRYCVDISNQLLATEAVIKRANREVVSAHMRSCVRHAVENGDTDKKIEEIIALIEKMSK